MKLKIKLNPAESLKKISAFTQYAREIHQTDPLQYEKEEYL